MNWGMHRKLDDKHNLSRCNSCVLGVKSDKKVAQISCFVLVQNIPC